MELLLLYNSEMQCVRVGSLWTFKSDGLGFNWQCPLTGLCNLSKPLNPSIHPCSHMQSGNHNEIRDVKYQTNRGICQY